MSKTIGELTLNEVAKVCDECADGEFYDCPFWRVNIVNCANFDKKDLKCGLDEKWEERKK